MSSGCTSIRLRGAWCFAVTRRVSAKPWNAPNRGCLWGWGECAPDNNWVCAASLDASWPCWAGRKRNLLTVYLSVRYTAVMHVISRKALRVFWSQHPDSKGPLGRWFKIMRQTRFSSFAALRRTFPSADKIGELVVFNIAGNKYRLGCLHSLQSSQGCIFVTY